MYIHLLQLIQRYHTVCGPNPFRGFRIMRHHDYRGSLPVDDLEETEDFLRSCRIQIAGRLVRQKNRRVVDQRPGQTDLLCLPSGQLLWISFMELFDPKQLLPSLQVMF